jgi:hypothetical protein
MNAKPTRDALRRGLAVCARGGAGKLRSGAHSEGNGTQPPSKLVVHAQESSQGSGTFFVDPEIYTALTSPTIAYEPQIQRAKKAFFVDPVYASLDPAIRIAIVARSHAAPLATGNGKHQLKAVPGRLVAAFRKRRRHRTEKTGRPPPRLHVGELRVGSSGAACPIAETSPCRVESLALL